MQTWTIWVIRLEGFLSCVALIVWITALGTSLTSKSTLAYATSQISFAGFMLVYCLLVFKSQHRWIFPGLLIQELIQRIVALILASRWTAVHQPMDINQLMFIDKVVYVHEVWSLIVLGIGSLVLIALWLAGLFTQDSSPKKVTNSVPEVDSSRPKKKTDKRVHFGENEFIEAKQYPNPPDSATILVIPDK